MKDDLGAPTGIELLILSSSLDETEVIVTSLRNGGLAVHGDRLDELERFEEQLPGADWDLILCCAFDHRIDLDQVLGIYQDADRDIPLLVMADENEDPDRLLQAMRDGARDMVNRGELNHLQLVVAREFGDLQQRRELTRLRQRMMESEQRCLGLVDSSREAIAFIQDGMHVHVNSAYLKLFGFPDRADVEDLPLLDLIAKDNRKALKSAFKKLDGDRKAVDLDLLFRREDGETVDAAVSLIKATMDGEPGIQIIVRDKASSTKEMEKQIQRLANIDMDTQLPNRHYFMGQLERWAKDTVGEDAVTALLLVSIDSYRRLRSSQGVAQADALVKAYAGHLRQSVASSDSLARFSDNSFALLCRRNNVAEVEQLSEALLRRVGEIAADGVAEDGSACSIGGALFGGGAEDPHELINRAFGAGESAREQGGDRVVLVEAADETPEDQPQDVRLTREIESALADERFRLLFQPIVSLQGDTRENYAVLVRMLDDAGDDLLPEYFIKQAEQAGLMQGIDRWVIRNAIATLTEQRQQGRKVNFFVTLSEPSLTDKNLLLWICDCLREFKARGGWLTFQIREKHVRDHLREANKLIDGLKKIKCQIALDHFGLLPKPEVLLEHLAVDFVKLAPGFARDLSADQQKQDDLNAMNELIVEHGMKTVATAVEDGNSLTVLWTVGIGYIQGYFLQEPSVSIEYGSQQLV